jgi:hypothetical protein
MKKYFFIPLLGVIVLACGALTPSVIPTISQSDIQAAIALTQTAAVSGAQLQPIELSNTPPKTETPVFPLSYVYEGSTQSCVCDNCFCEGNIDLVARITIDAQGHITGEFEKYLADEPPIKFERTKENIYGSFQIGLDKVLGIEEEKVEFTGNLADNYSTLEAQYQLRGRIL